MGQLSMAGRPQIVGQMTIALPSELLRRSEAWQQRRDRRAAHQAEFREARTHGLRSRHVFKQMRQDTDEALRELGLMPAQGAPKPARRPAAAGTRPAQAGESSPLAGEAVPPRSAPLTSPVKRDEAGRRRHSAQAKPTQTEASRAGSPRVTLSRAMSPAAGSSRTVSTASASSWGVSAAPAPCRGVSAAPAPCRGASPQTLPSHSGPMASVQMLTAEQRRSLYARRAASPAKVFAPASGVASGRRD